MPRRSPLAQAIREARNACDLTQEELGQHLGLSARAIYRWERDEHTPTDVNKQRVVRVIASLDAAVAAKLSAALAAIAAPPPAAAPPPPAVPARTLVENSLYRLVDDLDVPPRRVRSALVKWLLRVQESGLTLDVVQQHLSAWSDDPG